MAETVSVLFDDKSGAILGMTKMEKEAKEAGIIAQVRPGPDQQVVEVVLPQDLEPISLKTLSEDFMLTFDEGTPSLKPKG